MKLTIPHEAPAVLQREFLPVRAKIIEIAAALDRLDRSAGTVSEDPQVAQIRAALDELATPQPGRAERIQMIFSLPYDPRWRKTIKMPSEADG